MNYSLSYGKILFIAVAVVLVLVSGRLIRSHFESSYFIVAGSDFTDSTKTLSPVIVKKGQGYDGQFFYRYALNPFSFTKQAYGVTVDHPSYRVQRIAYPFFAWILSFGGIPTLVPFALILLNIIAFAGIFFYTGKFITLVNGKKAHALLPLLLYGIYMSVARDLSEVAELFCLSATIYYLFKTRYLLFAIFATLTILSRETSMISLAPLTACVGYKVFKNEMPKRALAYGVIPFLIFAAWKIFIYINIPSISDAAAGYGSVDIPFRGIIRGFRENLDFSTTTATLQFFFWMAYFCWQLFFVVMLFKNNVFKWQGVSDNSGMLQIVYLAWLLLAICFSDNIYGDDWGFVRVFSQWNMIGFMLLIVTKKSPGRIFIVSSAILAGLTIIRLIARV
jgi:hypothetical protein